MKDLRKRAIAKYDLLKLGIPETYNDVKLSDYQGVDAVALQVQKYLVGIDSGKVFKKGIGLYLQGDEHSQNLLLGYLVARFSVGRKYSARVMTLSQLAERTFDQQKIDEISDSSLDSLVKSPVEAEMLVLADLGETIRPITAFRIQTLYDIILHRSLIGRPTVICCSLKVSGPEDSIESVFNKKISQTILNNYIVISCPPIPADKREKLLKERLDL